MSPVIVKLSSGAVQIEQGLIDGLCPFFSL